MARCDLAQLPETLRSLIQSGTIPGIAEAWASRSDDSFELRTYGHGGPDWFRFWSERVRSPNGSFWWKFELTKYGWQVQGEDLHEQKAEALREDGMAKPLLVAIGVHKAATMPVLAGVLESVDALSVWARGAGYELARIDDQNGRVTVARIKSELTPVSAATGDPDPKRLLDRPRIVVYFCGHGLHAPQDQYWILSAGPDQPNERISAVAFREALATYGPRQIALISDACRSAQVVQGLGSSVVDHYQGVATGIQKDNFFSVQDGGASFAVPATQGKPAYCVFSSVLMRALSHPPDPEALDELYLQTGRTIVSSQSLANYLEKKVPAAALGVNRLQIPQCDPGFRPVKNGYVEFVHVPVAVARSVLATRQETMERTRAEAQNHRISLSRSEWRRPYVEDLQPLIGSVLSERIASYKRSPLLLSSNSAAPSVEAPKAISTSSSPAAQNLLGYLATRMRWNLIALVRKPFADSGRSGVAVVRMADLFAALPLHHRLWCTAIIDKERGPIGAAGGVELLAWGDQYRPPGPPPTLSAAEALKGLSAGTLNAEDTSVLADDMRNLKHADPMYGIVAAYLYSAIGDVANIRRMCHYYQRHTQDVPFDIAMLAQLELKRRPDGGFVVEVPGVAELPAAERRADAPF